MQQTPFHVYYKARQLEQLSDEEQFISVYASSDIKIYPFQIAATSFVLHSPYQKGAILCDEAGMGKSHEAMLVITQKWLEGKSRILLVIPNIDLLWQWIDMLESYYTVPYTIITNKKQWQENKDYSNAFIQDTIVITTYDFLADNEDYAKLIDWDLIVFEEANILSSVYQDDNKQAKALKRIADNSFKLLLTGTPIEKNIMDLYGLIYFIDETILPNEKEFLSRYLRKPENYPELSSQVSRYCFRTLRSQAKCYAKVPKRILMTIEYTPSEEERRFYNLLYNYINKPYKIAFPEMNQYDLALKLMGLLGSSTAAIIQTIKNIIKRITDDKELFEWNEMLTLAQSITQDSKAKELINVLKQCFLLIKKTGAKQKAVIFTESIETQKMLYDILSKEYKTFIYNGNTDFSGIQQFKTIGEILISTDNGAKGFNLQESAFIIHYDLPYNTLKMEQRIDRCHRLGQENDVLSVAFIDKNNLADVRKLELVNKRMLVTDGVFGITDDIIGGFTDDINIALPVIAERLRHKTQIENDFQQILNINEKDNKQIVSNAENILFTTFTKELADKVKISPSYINKRAEELNNTLWEVVKYFFETYNNENTDCFFEIDNEKRTITATNYNELPVLFYYWTGSRNKPYRSQKVYSMAKDFKPKSGQITLSSIIGKGILHELECANQGEVIIDNSQYKIEGCQIGLYTVTITDGKNEKEYSVLCGITESGNVLNDTECRKILDLPVIQYSENEHKSPHWLKNNANKHKLDEFVPKDSLLANYTQKTSPAKTEEIDRMKQMIANKKAQISREINKLDSKIREVTAELETVTSDRLKRLSLQKKVNQLRQEFMKREENQFFDSMRLDLELEEQIKAFMDNEKIDISIVRDFIITIVDVLN